jgi:hypothetical protein
VVQFQWNVNSGGFTSNPTVILGTSRGGISFLAWEDNHLRKDQATDSKDSGPGEPS